MVIRQALLICRLGPQRKYVANSMSEPVCQDVVDLLQCTATSNEYNTHILLIILMIRRYSSMMGSRIQ